MNLYFLRHASAGVRRTNPVLDLKRPLDKEGKEHCLRLAQVLNSLKISFDMVISSPLKRSLQTAQFVATETGYEAQILLSSGLGPSATFADFRQMLDEQINGSENVLIVGHSPNLQLFLGSMLVPRSIAATGKSIPQIRMRKGSIARLAIIPNCPAVLQSLVDPRTIRSLYATSTKSSRRKISRK